MDIQLNYVERGQGKPLVLLHGNGEDSAYFSQQMDCFSATRRVIAVDTQGHGKSPRGTAPFTIRQFAKDLAEFLDGMDLPQTDLLGFSDGGNIALIFALEYPERVDRLILNGANLDASGVKRHVQLPIALGYRVAKAFSKKNPEVLRHAELLGLMVNDPNIPVEKLETVTAPTLVIAGTKDMIREAHTRLIAARIPGARMVLIPGDHFVAAKNPSAFNAAVAEFLNEAP